MKTYRIETMNQNKKNCVRLIRDFSSTRSDLKISKYSEIDREQMLQSQIERVELYRKYRVSTLDGLPNGQLRRHAIPDRCDRWCELQTIKLERAS